MCGITGAFYAQNCKDKTENALPMAVELWQNQTSRGTRGFGAMTLLADRSFRIFRSTQETSILIDLKLHKLLQGEDPMGVLFHHRFPTSTPNLVGQTHPILVSHTSLKNDYYVVHNGVITNDEEVKKIHDAMGFVYTTLLVDEKKTEWNDSETIAIEFARAIEKRKHKIATFGAAALAAVAVDKETRLAHTLYLCTNGMNPLSYVYGKKSIYFASELKGEKVEENQLVKFDLVGGGLSIESIQFAKRDPIVPPSHRPPFHYNNRNRRFNFQTMKYEEDEDDRGYNTSKETKILLPPALKKEEPKEDEKPSPVLPITDEEYQEAMEALTETEDEDVEEINALFDEFVGMLDDPDSANIVHVDFYLDLIRKRMDAMQEKAIAFHEKRELEEVLKTNSILTDPYAGLDAE